MEETVQVVGWGSAGRSERNLRWILKHECQFWKWAKKKDISGRGDRVYSKQGAAHNV